MRYKVSDAEGNLIVETYVHTSRAWEPKLGELVRLGAPPRDWLVVERIDDPRATGTLIVAPLV